MKINDERKALEEMVKTAKQYQALLEVTGYNKICIIKDILDKSENWNLIDSQEVLGGMSETDIDECFDYYAPSIDCGLSIVINAYASHATIRKLTKTELKTLELNQSQKTSPSLDPCQNACADAPKR